MSPHSVWKFLFAVLVVGCATPYQVGVRAYSLADYPAAAEAFQHVDTQPLSAADRARVTLYTGLTYLALGDTHLAVGYLTLARLTREHDPTLFEPVDARRLESAWTALGLMPGDAPVVARH